MILYYRANRKAVDRILKAGWRDGVGTYLTGHRWRGVLLSDNPSVKFIFVGSEGASSEDVLVRVYLDIPIPEVFEKYKRKIAGAACRAFLIPATVLNQTAGRIDLLTPKKPTRAKQTNRRNIGEGKSKRQGNRRAP